MEKETLIFLLAIPLLISIVFAINAESLVGSSIDDSITNSSIITGKIVTGETVTGEATGAVLAVTITILTPPFLTIIKPKNETYITNNNLRLHFSASGEDNVFYNIDSGSNTTITGNTTFSTTSGTHTLYLYANNSEGTTSKNITFTVDASKFKIDYEEYRGSNNGDSTNFNQSSYEDLQNLSGIILEHTDWGKIVFSGAINLTADENSSDHQTNISASTNISSNRIEINTTALPNFNVSATLSLYNLTFTNPRVLRDGSVCPSTICTEVNYSDNTFIFNVTQFTVYSAEETPSDDIVQPSPSGGGGGSVSEEKIEFLLNPKSYERTVAQNRIEYGEIEITNQEKSDKYFNIKVESIENIISFEERIIQIFAGETKKIEFKIQAPEKPGIYTGKIIVTSGSTAKEILVIINVKTEKSLFDIAILLPKQTINVGENLSAQIDLFQIGIKEEINVTLHYIIKNFEENTHLSESEITTIYDQKSLIKTFSTEKFEAENYVFGVELIYPEGVAVASSRFKIKEKIEITFMLVLSALFIIFVFIIIFLTIKKHKKRIEPLHKIRKA